MAVDVLFEIAINVPPAPVAAYEGDPSNGSRWYANIESIEWRTPPR